MSGIATAGLSATAGGEHHPAAAADTTAAAETARLHRGKVPGAWRAWEKVEAIVRRGEVLVLDGATGTELERRGAKMDEKGWACATQLYEPEIVTEVHSCYIDAGADIIITNTYATNRNVMESAGIGSRTDEAIHLAADCARAARRQCTRAPSSLSPPPLLPTFSPGLQCTPASSSSAAPSSKKTTTKKKRGRDWPLIAGSLSTHPPALEFDGSEHNNATHSCTYPAPEREAEAYLKAAEAQAASGVDFLFLEMMKNDHAHAAVAAAAQSGLPIFLGVSTRMEQDGSVVQWGNGSNSVPFTPEWLKELVDLAGPNLVGINVMHTNFSAMLPSLRIVREIWSGALGAYPDHGFFKMPSWEFAEVDVEAAMEMAAEWMDDCGITLLGGCCGTGPELIAGFAELAAERNSRLTPRPPMSSRHAHAHL